MFINSKLLAQLRDTSRDAVDSHDAVVSFVPALNNRAGPFDVTGNVSEIVVDSVYRKAFWTFAKMFRNILEKVRELFPIFKDSYSSAAVLFPILVIGISASSNQSNPCRIKAGPLPAFCVSVSCPDASARLTDSASQIAVANNSFGSAFAKAKTGELTLAVCIFDGIRLSKHFPLAESETNDRDLFRHGIGISMLCSVTGKPATTGCPLRLLAANQKPQGGFRG